MEVDYKSVDMERHARAIEAVWPDGQHGQTYRAGWIAGVNAVQDDLDALRQALAAAEAECAAARTALSPPPLQMAGPNDNIVLQPLPARRWADLRQAANANDATRARLGLGKIGEAR
jgi:hypothetical protein